VWALTSFFLKLGAALKDRPDGTLQQSMKNTNNETKFSFKDKKRILKVFRALTLMEQHTEYIAGALHPILYAATRPVETAKKMPPARPQSNKKKMDEFRENWLDKQEVIRLMPVSERSLYALRKEGKLPSYTFKGKIYFKLQDVESLMQSKDPEPVLES
jgi:hypothetical protein